MLQYLSTLHYFSSHLTSIFPLPSRDTSTDSLHLTHQDSHLNDWLITATDNILHLVTSNTSTPIKTIAYDLPIAFLVNGESALRIILEDGSHHFLVKPDTALATSDELDMSSSDPCFLYLLLLEAISAKADLIKQGVQWLTYSKIDEMADALCGGFDQLEYDF